MARRIGALRDEYLRQGPDAVLDAARELRAQQTPSDAIVRACALSACACEQQLGLRPFDVQLMAGAALCEGHIVQMNTGEGKTLTATLPAFYHALFGEGVHVATVNEYLAARDRSWMAPVYEALGISAGLVLAEDDAEAKRAAYACDVTYATATELGFDYLRDGIAHSLGERVQRGLARAIVDEIDSILLDEAVTPMILSGGGVSEERACREADTFARYLRAAVVAKLDEDEQPGDIDADYVVDEQRRAVYLCPTGITKAQQFYRTDNLFDEQHLQVQHYIMQALKAHGLMKRDVDYIVQDGAVRVVDRHTGRVMAGRRFSQGLHQAIEAKEGAEHHAPSDTVASITYQCFFRQYGELCGMTGTAHSARAEFERVYRKSVLRVPPHMPCVRIDRPDVVFEDQQARLEASVVCATKEHRRGRPVLIGTNSVGMSEGVSAALAAAGVPHEVLNAKNHAREAELIAAAGRSGAVTVATEMAGRGTDIVLGGGDAADAQRVRSLGGLLVIGVGRHESRRVDDQLIGRAGRQGDPGESRFFIAADDELFRLHGEEGAALTPKVVRHAQQVAQSHAAASRRRALESDEVVQRQRAQLLEIRERALRGEGLAELSRGMMRTAEQDETPLDARITELDDEAFARLSSALLLYHIDRGWSEYLRALEQLKSARYLAEHGEQEPVARFVQHSYALFDECVSDMRESYLHDLLHAEYMN